MVKTLELEFRILDNKVRFVLAVVEGKMKVNNRKKKQIVTDLKKLGFETFYTTGASKTLKPHEEDADMEVEGEEDGEALSSKLEKLAQGYNYLMSMKLWSLTLEKVEKLRSEQQQKLEELEELKGTPVRQLWVNDLDAIEELLDEMDEQEMKAKLDEQEARKVARGEAVRKGRARKGVKGVRGKRRGWKATGEPMSASDPESSDEDIEMDSKDRVEESASSDASDSSEDDGSEDSSDTSDSEDEA